MTRHEVVTAGGVRLAYRESGPPNGPVMVLLHALGEQGSDWDAVTPRFAERYRVLAFDLRGHGDSDRPGDYAMALMARDVEDALDRVALAGVVMVGHSLGGHAALTLAARRPDLVRRLVLEDVAPPLGRPRRPLPERPDGDLPFDWAVVEQVRAEVDDGDPQLWEALPVIDVPTLVVAGGRQDELHRRHLAAAAARLPDADLVTLDASHYVHQERAAEFADVVLAWLARRGDG